MQDTIAAIATPPGRGGVGIVRVSGPKAEVIGRQLGGSVVTLSPRVATYTTFHDEQGQVLDQGLLLYFKAPHSFTGEDVVEFQGHGGPVVMELLLKAVLRAGARLARAGEFSERAFLNDKLDLTQAEAIADLIEAGSEQAARSALSSLQGAFSQRVNELLTGLIQLRLHVEAAIDFPEEEIDFLADGQIVNLLRQVQQRVDAVLAESRQGSLLREGMQVVIAGSPNAGKSSLLNALAGRDIAIVTDIAGTTRDVLREHLQIDGMPLHVVDTAGLRESPDVVEQEGIRRAYQAVAEADLVLFVFDATSPDQHPALRLSQFFPVLPPKLLLLANKCDLLGEPLAEQHLTLENRHIPLLGLSAQTGEGLPALREALKQAMGYHGGVGAFSARRRHVMALEKTAGYLSHAMIMLNEHRAGELVAEDLRLAQLALSEITGVFTSDDLLGHIFSSFCIGK